MAVGGVSIKQNPSKEIHQYNSVTDSWEVVCQMKTARSYCAAALLPGRYVILGRSLCFASLSASASECKYGKGLSPNIGPAAPKSNNYARMLSK